MPLAQCHHSGSLEAADGFVYTVGFVFSLGYNKKWSRFMTCSGSAGTRTISRSGFLRGLQSNRSDHWDGLMLDRSAVGQLSSLSGRTEWQRLPAGDTLRSVWHYVVCMCHTELQSSSWYRAVIPGTTHLCCCHTWSTSTPLCLHRPPGSTLFQTFHHRQPSFSGCRLTDLELTTRNSRFGINIQHCRIGSSTNWNFSIFLYLLALY